MKHRLPCVASFAVFILCCGQSGSLHAQPADIQTIVSVGGPPVVLNQNSQTNMAGVFMVGGSTSATVVQNGTNNATGILQFGGANSSSIGQTGTFNFTFVGQSGLFNSSNVNQTAP